MDTKNKTAITKGIIINDEDKNEYDKLITILTSDFGKIYVYSFGVKRQKSVNISKTNLFTYGNFEIKIVKGKYNLVAVDVINNFFDLSKDIDNIYISSYFLEILNYFSFENIDGSELIDITVNAFNALIKNKMDKGLIMRVFELRILKEEGIFFLSDNLPQSTKETVKWTWDYVISKKSNEIFNFNLKEEYKTEFIKLVDYHFKKNVDKKFKTLEMINV